MTDHISFTIMMTTLEFNKVKKLARITGLTWGEVVREALDVYYKHVMDQEDE